MEREARKPHLTVNVLNNHPWLFAALLAGLALAVQVQLNLSPDLPIQQQLRRLNPDSRLYYQLASNLLTGKGFHDTTRNQQITPSIGHPLWLAVVSGPLGLSPARQAWLSIWLSVGFLALAAFVYTGGNFLLLAVWLYSAYLSGIVWLAGNVETSIVLTNTSCVGMIRKLRSSDSTGCLGRYPRSFRWERSSPSTKSAMVQQHCTAIYWSAKFRTSIAERISSKRCSWPREEHRSEGSPVGRHGLPTLPIELHAPEPFGAGALWRGGPGATKSSPAKPSRVQSHRRQQRN